MLNLSDINVENRRVVLRVDFNVPISDGTVRNDERLLATIPAIEYCLSRNAEIFLVSHLGRPKGENKSELSLRPVAQRLAELLGKRVEFVVDWYSHIKTVERSLPATPGKISLFENLRFDPREEANDTEFGVALGSIGEVYVFEAFATAHRAHASTHTAIKTAQISCSGPHFAREIQTLSKVMKNPTRPLVAVVGGAKVSGKLEVLEQLGKIADSLLLGGGLANTLLLAKGLPIGRSLVDQELVPKVQRLTVTTPLIVPVDVMVCSEVASDKNSLFRMSDEVSENEMIIDIGPETARQFAKIIKKAGTVLWNGPMGIFEIDQFGEGTRVVTSAVADSSGFSVAGGGDTLAAIAKYSSTRKFNYISTGGGAFLEFIEGRNLPAIEALRTT